MHDEGRTCWNAFVQVDRTLGMVAAQFFQSSQMALLVPWKLTQTRKWPTNCSANLKSWSGAAETVLPVELWSSLTCLERFTRNLVPSNPYCNFAFGLRSNRKKHKQSAINSSIGLAVSIHHVIDSLTWGKDLLNQRLRRITGMVSSFQGHFVGLQYLSEMSNVWTMSTIQNQIRYDDNIHF